MDLAALDALDEMPEDSDDDEVVQALGALLGAPHSERRGV